MKITNKTKKKADLFVVVIIIIGIASVLNFFSYQFFYRWDLTQGKDFSISSTSKNAVSKLDDVVNIKLYFSRNLPAQYLALHQEVNDILDEYANYSKGRIKIENADIKDDDETKRELYMAGIPELQFNSLEKDKYQVVKGYMGLVVQYGDKKEALPVIQDTNNLEYQVTLAIKKVTSAETPAIGFLTSNGTASLEGEVKTAYQELSKIYTISNVDLKTMKEIPSEISTLVIVGPKEKFSADQLKMIDKFFISGKSLLVLLDGVNIGDGLSATVNDTGLETLLKNYGIALNKDLVLDASAGTASFSQGYMTFMTPYPFWPKVLKGTLDSKNPIAAKLESITFPWTSSIELIPEKSDKDNKISFLAQTTKQGRMVSGDFNLNPQQEFGNLGKGGQYTLALSDYGKFKSAYGKDSTDKGRIIAIGSSNFIKDGFIRNMPDNLVFFQNMVDSLSLDEDLINIRSKGITERPIREMSEGAKAAVRYSNIFGLTILVVAYGLFRYFLRRRSKFVDEL